MEINFHLSNKAIETKVSLNVWEDFDKLWFLDFMTLHWNVIIEIILVSIQKSYYSANKVKKISELNPTQQKELNDFLEERFSNLINVITSYFDNQTPFKNTKNLDEYSFKYI